MTFTIIEITYGIEAECAYAYVISGICIGINTDFVQLIVDIGIIFSGPDIKRDVNWQIYVGGC